MFTNRMEHQRHENPLEMHVWNMCSLDRNESESLRKCVAKLKLWNPRNPTNIAWKFIQPMYLLRETHFSCLLRFFTRSPFILTFLYPYGLDSCSFQVKMTCPVQILVNKHVEIPAVLHTTRSGPAGRVKAAIWAHGNRNSHCEFGDRFSRSWRKCNQLTTAHNQHDPRTHGNNPWKFQ